MSKPKAYSGIMVSSTFSDLKDHRAQVIDATEKLGFRANVMESSGAQASMDVIDTSLQMVRDSVAFIGLISHRYGQTPEDAKRNPDGLSVSELEFNEAMRLGRPILLFIMGDDHPVKPRDVEVDPDKIAKLNAFRERAKKKREDSPVERIYEIFNSPEEFAKNAAIAVGRLAKDLEAEDPKDDDTGEDGDGDDSFETAVAPNLRAIPRYLGSHDFIGRQAELNALNDWCADADPHPMLLFEAIGGTGKSMVTWTWLTDHVMHTRDDWAGRFWFSFYEGGATMNRFCQQAMAYMTGQPVKVFNKQKTRALMPQLIALLEAQPWLMVLDGLERILVAYHRIDAPQMRDEDVDTAEDQIANRDPREVINPEDKDLLRALAGVKRSKLLITSRLTPEALINASAMPVPGVRREMLPGLRPADAEALLRACDVSGDGKVIQDYLQRNCDCHPLVIGALAGLVNEYLPDRGNFDAWLADPEAGGKLGLADMNLTQRRNHILDTAIAALPDPALRLLQTLSLLQGGADYALLKEFNPHLPPPPEEVEEPTPPEEGLFWNYMNDDQKEEATQRYKQQQQAYPAYLASLNAWKQKPDVQDAPKRFNETIALLERRGLLQYDHASKCYDLHPVVRGVSSGRMGEVETSEVGGQVVDHFSSRQHDPYEQAETLDDVAPGIQLVTTFTRMGAYDRALSAFKGELDNAIYINLDAKAEAIRLLRPFFPDGWNGQVRATDLKDRAWLITKAAGALQGVDNEVFLQLVTRVIPIALSEGYAMHIGISIRNLSIALAAHGDLAASYRLRSAALELSEAANDQESIFMSVFHLFQSNSLMGNTVEADALWRRLDGMEQPSSRGRYQSGNAEWLRANDLFLCGELTDEVLAEAERLCRDGRNRSGVRGCLELRGEWYLSTGNPDWAIEPLNEALRMARESGLDAPSTEVMLALARLRTGDATDAREVAHRMEGKGRQETAVSLAELWIELDEPERAKTAALRAHELACGSGEPYVYRYHLDRAEALLRQLGETPPPVPKYDPSKDEIFEWEDDVHALIEKTRKKREERERKEAEKKKAEQKKDAGD